MKRILIMGNPGAGKSTLAIEMGKILELPVIHLDKVFWKPGWIMTENEILRPKVRDMVSADHWIIDGTYVSSIDIRLPRADTIIYMDFSTPRSMLRILKRIIRGYNNTRPDMAEGCPEKIDFTFFKWTWNFRKNIRPKIMADIKRHSDGRRIVILENPRQVSHFLEEISSSEKLSDNQ